MSQSNITNMNPISFNGYLTQQQVHVMNIEKLIKKKNQVRDILPLKIKNGFEIKKLEWTDFVGQPPKNSYWLAFVYYNTKYQPKKVEKQQIMRSPQLMKQQQSKQLPRLQSQGLKSRLQNINFLVSPKKILNENPDQQQFKYTVSVETTLSNKAWTRCPDDNYLLEHESGHYLIGCLCALEFKRQCEIRKFASELEIKVLYQSISKDFSKIQRQYDDETEHYLNQEMQNQWNMKIKEQLLLYEKYFEIQY